MISEICGNCGNFFPSWANGVCPVCTRIDRDNRRFGDSYNSRNTPIIKLTNRNQIPASNRTLFNVSAQFTKIEYRVKKRTPGLRVRMQRFNKFLEDVYREPIRLSQLLSRQGISQVQVEVWKKDLLWQIGFLDRFEKELLDKLNRALPERKSEILGFWYGLSESEKWQVWAIADQLNIPYQKVNEDYNVLLDYLRDKAKTGAVGRLILEIAKQNPLS